MRLIGFLVLAALWLGAAGPALAGLGEAEAALEAGRFRAAVLALAPLAKAGDAKAQRLLAGLYTDGLGLKHDPAKAAAWLRRAADQGDAEAEARLGLMYTTGVGVGRVSYVKAAQWFAKAAAQGHAVAQRELGYQLERGLGVELDRDRGVELLRAAHRAGDGRASYLLGTLYAKGKIGWGFGRTARAAELYRAAAAAGDVDGQFALGDLLYRGDGVTRDMARALDLFLRAARQGSAKAQHNLAVMYAKGEGVPENQAEAIYWLRRAAAQRIAQSRFLLGARYVEGQGVPRDRYHGYVLIAFAAGELDPGAQAWLAAKLAAIPKSVQDAPESAPATADVVRLCLVTAALLDHQNARRICRIAADRGSALSAFMVGRFHDLGIGGGRDRATALAYYEQAAQAGDVRARAALARMLAGDPASDAPTRARAARLMGAAAKTGLPEAMAHYAVMAAKGIGLRADPGLALAWRIKAAEAGDSRSQITLGAAVGTGRAGPVDLVEAMKWFLVAERPLGLDPDWGPRIADTARRNQKLLGPRLTDAQRAEALRRAQAWRPAPSLLVAAPTTD